MFEASLEMCRLWILQQQLASKPFSPNIHLTVGKGGNRFWLKNNYPLLESKSHLNNHSVVFNSMRAHSSQISGWGWVDGLNVWPRYASQSHYTQLLKNVQAHTHRKAYLQQTYNCNEPLLEPQQATSCKRMVHRGCVIRRTLKTGQDAAISNDNCKEVITKYVCPGEGLPPNPLVLLASF